MSSKVKARTRNPPTGTAREEQKPELRYEVDAYHSTHRCGLGVEAGRAWQGNAIYRNLIQGAMIVEVDVLTLGVPNLYKYTRGTNPIFDKTKDVVEILYRTDWVNLPYDVVLI